jgi:hypothetical protein
MKFPALKFPNSKSLSASSVAVIAALAVTPAAAVTVGQWNFEEGTPGNPVVGANSVLDQSGNANHGSPNGNPMYSGDVAPGGGNTSLALDGNGDFIGIAHSASLNTISAFTVEFSMKAGTAGNSGLRLLVDKSHGFVDSTGWTFQMNNGRINLNIGAGGGGASNFPGGADTTDLRDDQWHHIAGTYDVSDAGQELKLYIDGVLEGAFSVGTYAGNTRDVIIGAACTFAGCPFGAQRFYNGLIDDLRISDTALTADQFLNASTEIPAPAAIILFAVAVAGMGLKRRQSRI